MNTTLTHVSTANQTSPAAIDAVSLANAEATQIRALMDVEIHGIGGGEGAVSFL